METQKQTQQSAQLHTAQEKKPVAGGLFEGLSVPQVAAGALAAVTSLLLSSKIGWGGSAIGVAVGSVVSTVSSQVYKKFFQKSADKIKDVVTSSGPTGTAAMPAVDEDPSGVADRVAGAPLERDPYAAGATPHARAGATQQMGRPGSQGTVAHPVVNDDAILQATAETHRSSKTGTRVVSDRLEHKVQQRQKERKRAKVQKSVIVVSIVSAILAMLISAGVVSCATSGEGIGSKPAPIVKVPSSSDSHDSASSSSSQASESASSSEASDQSSSDSSDQTTKQGVVIDESGSGNGASGSGNSGTSNAGTSNAGASGNSESNAGTSGTNGSGSGTSGTATSNDSGSGNSNSGSGSGTSGTTASKDSGASTSGQSTASDSGASGSGTSGSGSGSTK